MPLLKLESDLKRGVGIESRTDCWKATAAKLQQKQPHNRVNSELLHYTVNRATWSETNSPDDLLAHILR